MMAPCICICICICICRITIKLSQGSIVVSSKTNQQTLSIHDVAVSAQRKHSAAVQPTASIAVLAVCRPGFPSLSSLPAPRVLPRCRSCTAWLGQYLGPQCCRNSQRLWRILTYLGGRGTRSPESSPPIACRVRFGGSLHVRSRRMRCVRGNEGVLLTCPAANDVVRLFSVQRRWHDGVN